MIQLWLRYQYGFEMTLAYLADGMGDKVCRENHVNRAEALIGMLDIESIQGEQRDR